MLGYAEELPLPENCIDVIISNNGLNNVQDLDKSLQECIRVLKKNGQLVFTMNLTDSMFEFYSIYEQILLKHHLLIEVKQLRQH